MELAFAFFAEAAQISSDGKLNVLGADIRALQGTFPFVLRSVAFVAKVELDPAEREGMHKFVAQMFGPTGEALEPCFEGQYKAPAQLDPDLKVAFTVVLQILGMTFPAPGVFTFQISVDGRELKRLRLRLSAIQENSKAVNTQEENITR